MDYSKYILTHTKKFLDKYYNYVYLKATIMKAQKQSKSGSVLITGSSHSLGGIDIRLWENTFNCSMHSQDLYYDFKCAKEVLDVNASRFSKCIIVMGYYMPCHDLSLAKRIGPEYVSKIYYPIFSDPHNCKTYDIVNLHEGFEFAEGYACEIEKNALDRLAREGNYYNFYKKRAPFIPADCVGVKRDVWSQLSSEDKEIVGMKRAQSHARLTRHTDSLIENKEIFSDYIHYLTLKNIMPIVVVTPYAKQYNKYVDKLQIEQYMELLNSCEEEVHYVNFNESDMFEDIDFVDADHLSEYGARKVTLVLREMFGESK